MATHSQLIPGPMTDERLATMQARLEAGKELAQAADQDFVTDSIQRRHASQRKNGFNAQARSVGHKRTTVNSDARFTGDGDEIDRSDNVWAAIDLYSESPPGTRESCRLAGLALADWVRRFRSAK